TPGSYITPAGLPPGTYFARTVNSLNYSDQLYRGTICTNCVVTAGTPIQVTANGTTAGISFALVKAGQISGTVTDAVTGAALAGASVGIYNSQGGLVTTTATN